MPSIAASAAPALAAAATGAFEGAAIVALERVSSERRSVEEGEEVGPQLEESEAARRDNPMSMVLYEANVELRKARRYRLALVGSNGQALGPPLAIMTAIAGRAHAASCMIGGDGLDKGFLGQPVDFWMRTYDAAGNALSKGGEKVSLHVKTPGHNDTALTIKVRDDKDGTYSLKFVPTVSGMHVVTVKMGKETVGPTISIMIYRSAAAAASALKLNIGAVHTGSSPASARGDGTGTARGSLSSARASARSMSPGAPMSARRESSPRRSPGGPGESPRRAPAPSDSSPRRSPMPDSSPRSNTRTTPRVGSPRLPRPIHPQTLSGIPPDLVPAAAPSADGPPLAPRGTPPLAPRGHRRTPSDEYANAPPPTSARGNPMAPSAAAPSAEAYSTGSPNRKEEDREREATGSTPYQDRDARRPPRATPGSASTPNLPPKLPINTSGIKVSFTPDEADPKSEPKRAESARGPARRESKGTPRGSALRDDNAPATARGAGPQRHASPQRPSSARGAAPAP